MSKAFQFPQDPNRPNPFADPASTPATLTDNPYGTSLAAAAPVGGEANYQALPHRGVQLIIFGLLGAMVLVCSLPFTYFCAPLGAIMAVLNFGFTVPAWLMGRSDLKAMKVGAINPSGRSLTHAGWLLGAIGTVGNLGAMALTLARILFFSID